MIELIHIKISEAAEFRICPGTPHLTEKVQGEIRSPNQFYVHDGPLLQLFEYALLLTFSDLNQSVEYCSRARKGDGETYTRVAC